MTRSDASAPGHTEERLLPDAPMRVVAILAAYNEEDIIGQVVAHLIEQGVSVYFLDNGSTDGTVRAVEPFLGRGVLRIERFPEDAGTESQHVVGFAWEQILKRKEALARELDADWFIHHDADEFRESMWPGHTLRESIQVVDRLGYNAIDFAVLNFWPTHDRFEASSDIRDVFQRYEPGQVFDRVQVKCWKKTAAAVDLSSTGGHDASFDGRRVFPIRFILRHYPIRSQEHGRRKVLIDRRPRFLDEERARGWHVQYDEISEHHAFLRDPATLAAYDAEAVRWQLVLENRGLEELRAVANSEHARLTESLELHVQEIRRLGAERDERTQELAVARSQHDAQVAEVSRVEGVTEEQAREIESLRSLVEERQSELLRLQAAVEHLEQRVEIDQARFAAASEQATSELVALASELEGLREVLAASDAAMSAKSAELRGVYASRSWRVTVPLRWVYDRLLA